MKYIIYKLNQSVGAKLSDHVWRDRDKTDSMKYMI